MRLGGEVDDVVSGFYEGSRHRGVANVAVHKGVARVVDHVVQVFHAAGVGQLVEIRDLPVGMGLQRVADEVAANEAGAAGDENFNHDSQRF